MKQILRYLKPYLGKLLAATVLIALSTLCDLLLPTWMSAILNGGIAARDFPAIAVRCLQMLAIAAVSLASILGGTRLSTEVVACFCADLRADVFRKVNTLSFEEFGSLGTAALVTRATHDVDTVSWVASMLSGTVATIPMLFLGGVVLAMRKDVVLSLVLLAFVPLLTLIVVLLGKRVLPLWGKSDDYIDVQNALLRERLRGIRVIRAFNTEKREHGRIADATHIMAENIIRANVSMGLLTPLATLFLNISALLIIYLGGWRMVHGVSGVSAGDIFAIIQYVTMVMNGVIMASFAIIMYPRAQVAAGRIHQVLGAEGMGDPMAGETAELHGEIELQDVSFSYGGSADAISHVSLHILPGQRISVIGGTGSGKSTLMHLLLGFRAPTQGRILFDGRDAAGLSKHTLRRGISSVLQGAAILAAATLIVKLLGFLFKTPLNYIIGETGSSYFYNAYRVYDVLLMISTTGLAVAMSRMISQAQTLGNHAQIRRIYKTSLYVFLTIGVVGSLGMLIFCKPLSVMVTTDAEQTKAAVDSFAQFFNDAVEAKVKERLKGEPPRKGPGSAAPMTKEQIMAIRDPELRQKKMLENKELFNF